MDNKTTHILSEIGRQIPRDIKKKLSGERKVDEFDERMKEITFHNLKKIEDPLKRKQIEYFLQHSVSEGEIIPNKKAEREAEHFVEYKVKKLIDSGKIPAPKVDSEMKYWMKKMKK